MIGVSGKDAVGTKQLFRQHHPRQQMRPDHRPERQLHVGTGKHGGIETIGTADRAAVPRPLGTPGALGHGAVRLANLGGHAVRVDPHAERQDVAKDDDLGREVGVVDVTSGDPAGLQLGRR